AIERCRRGELTLEGLWAAVTASFRGAGASMVRRWQRAEGAARGAPALAMPRCKAGWAPIAAGSRGGPGGPFVGTRVAGVACRPQRHRSPCALEAAMSEPVLRLNAIEKSFGALKVTDNLSLDVREGETHAIIGPNGAGKTTLIDQIAGALIPDAGR